MAEIWSVGRCAALACLMEVTACKPGNVHRAADFPDVGFFDFVRSAVAIEAALEAAATHGSVGRAAREAIAATREVVATNTNLGIVLLLAPLACVPAGEPLRTGVERVLAGLTAADSAGVYEAIRLAKPGGMGSVPNSDVAGPAPADLREAMRLAADRDLVARQYVDGFAAVFDLVLPSLTAELAAGRSLEAAIVRTHLVCMARHPDSLIARKAGAGVATEASRWAQRALDAGPADSQDYLEAVADLDFMLRSDGTRRNPGTTADLVTAGLFVGLRTGAISPAARWHNPFAFDDEGDAGEPPF